MAPVPLGGSDALLEDVVLRLPREDAENDALVEEQGKDENDAEPLSERETLPEKEPLRQPDTEGVTLPLKEVEAVAYPEALPLSVPPTVCDDVNVVESDTNALAEKLLLTDKEPL